MDGRPYLIPSKGIDAPSISKTNYGEKLGEKIKKGMTTLAKAHEGDVKDRKDKAVKNAGAVKKLAMLEARAGMERSGKADLQYPASPINKPHLDAAASIKKVLADSAKRSEKKQAASSAAAAKAGKSPAGKSVPDAKPAAPYVGPAIASYGGTKRGRRVAAPQGAPGTVKAARTPRRVGTATKPTHSGQSGAQFRSL